MMDGLVAGKKKRAKRKQKQRIHVEASGGFGIVLFWERCGETGSWCVWTLYTCSTIRCKLTATSRFDSLAAAASDV